MSPDPVTHMVKSDRRAIVAGTLTVMAALMTAVPAGAQQVADVAVQSAQLADERNFDIAAQPLTTALTQFGQQSGLQITVHGTLPRDRNATVVQGTMSSREALDRLLAGTGLVYSLVDGETVAIERPDHSDGEAVLAPIAVEGQLVAPSQAVVGNLPSEYAGGQVARGSRVGLLGNRDIFDTPFSVKSYTQNTIENQQATRIIDVVENDASVNVNLGRYSGNDQFMMRGFPIFNGDLLVDGLSGLTAGRATPIAGFERVELIKGPNAMLSGANVGGTVAGTVNLLPKRAGDEPITQITAEYEGDTIGGGKIDVGRRFGHDGEIGARLNISHRSGDTAVDLQDIRSTEFAGGFDYLGERFRASIDLGHVDEKIDAFSANMRANTGFALPNAPDADSNPKQPWEVQEDDFTYGLAAAEYDFLDDWTGTVRYGRSEWNEDMLATSIIRLTNTNGDFSSRAFAASMFTVSDTAEASVRGELETGAVTHEVSVLASGTWIESGSVTSVIPGVTVTSNIFDPIEIAEPDRPEIYVPKTSETFLSSYALADTVSAFDDRLMVTLGARHQTVQTKTFSAATGSETSNIKQSEVTPAAALLVKPLESLSLYGNYIEALTQGSTAPVGTANAGDVLAPIMTEQYEIGAKWDVGNFGVTGALFQITQPSALTDPNTNIFGVAGEQRNRGVELEIFGQPTDGLRLMGGITYTQGEMTKTSGGVNDGKTAVGVPEVQIRASAEWDVPKVEGATLIGRALYASEQFLDAGNTQAIPGWTRFDVGARYGFDAYETPMTARLDIENVAGNDYWQSTGRSFLSKGQPRTVLFSLTADF